MTNRRLVAALVAFTVGCLALAGCDSTQNLPDGGSLLTSAADSLTSVTSVHFDLSVSGDLSSMPIQSADGDLTKAGQARGNAKMSFAGQLVQVEYVLVAGGMYVKGVTGGYQRYPASVVTSIYNPAALLDPNSGVAEVLRKTTNAATQARENVNGTQADRVTGKVTKDVVAKLVPGIGADVSATYWIADDGTHHPVKAQFDVPAANGHGTLSASVTVTDFNKPVTIQAPS